MPVDSELDIAVDFVAPEEPGEYASYWRMSSPSGQQFGHRVWVVIQVVLLPLSCYIRILVTCCDYLYLCQVDGSHNRLTGNFHRLNLNLPPQNYGLKDRIVTDINAERSLNNPYGPRRSSSPAAFSSKLTDQQSNTVGKAVVELFAEVLDEDLESVSKEFSETKESASSEGNLNFPANDTSLPVTGPFVNSNSLDSEIEALPVNASLNVKNLVTSPQSETPEKGELSELGSNQAELDSEILKTMDSHLEQAHDFLYGMFGWDQILNELEKMVNLFQHSIHYVISYYIQHIELAYFPCFLYRVSPTRIKTRS